MAKTREAGVVAAAHQIASLVSETDNTSQSFFCFSCLSSYLCRCRLYGCVYSRFFVRFFSRSQQQEEWNRETPLQHAPHTQHATTHWLIKHGLILSSIYSENKRRDNSSPSASTGNLALPGEWPAAETSGGGKPKSYGRLIIFSPLL